MICYEQCQSYAERVLVTYGKFEHLLLVTEQYCHLCSNNQQTLSHYSWTAGEIVLFMNPFSAL